MASTDPGGGGCHCDVERPLSPGSFLVSPSGGGARCHVTARWECMSRLSPRFPLMLRGGDRRQDGTDERPGEGGATVFSVVFVTQKDCCLKVSVLPVCLLSGLLLTASFCCGFRLCV